jgi:hypothetical protein
MNLRVERLLECFEDRALRKILKLKREEETGSWRELHNGDYL